VSGCLGGKLFRRRRAAVFFFTGVMRFIREHALLGPTAAPPFLAANPLRFVTAGIHVTFLEGFDFIEQEAARQETVHALLPGGLAFDAEARGFMKEHHASRAFVHILPTVTAGANKGFLDVRLIHPQLGHAAGEFIGFLRSYRKQTHAMMIVAGRLSAREKGYDWTKGLSEGKVTQRADG